MHLKEEASNAPGGAERDLLRSNCGQLLYTQLMPTCTLQYTSLTWLQHDWTESSVLWVSMLPADCLPLCVVQGG